MDNIEDILRALAEDDSDPSEERGVHNKDGSGGSGDTCSGDTCSGGACSGDTCSDEGGLFSGLDPEMLLRMLSLFEVFNQPSDNERFLLALKPLLREENRPKIDSAVRLLKLISLLPILRQSGMLDKLL